MLLADEPQQVPGAVGHHHAVDLAGVLDGEQDALRPSSGVAARAAKLRSAARLRSTRADAARAALRRRPGRPAATSADTGCRTSFLRPPHSWMRLAVAVQHLEHRQGPPLLGQLARPCDRRGPGPSWYGSRRSPRRRRCVRWPGPPAATRSVSGVPPWQALDQDGSSLSAAVSCIRPTSGSSLPKVSASARRPLGRAPRPGRSPVPSQC